MIQFKDLASKFRSCDNYNETHNSIATIVVNEYQLDIIRKPKTKTYKVKPFETINGKKTYVPNIWSEYAEFPEFAGREALLVFLNELDKENLSDITSELDIDPEDIDL